MKKIKPSFLVFVLMVFLREVNAQKYTGEITPLPGEKWYGGYTAKAFCNTPLKNLNFQPYLLNEKKMDLSIDNRGNQAAPLLISNKGRYVWSDQPFAFEFRDGTLVVYSEFEQVVPVSAGKTLRDGFVGAKNKHFPPSGKTPNALMFSLPQYNTWIELGTNQIEKDILKYADNVKKNNFPSGVFMIDDNWSNDYGNYDFNLRTFPQAKAMIDELHKNGFKIMLWITPFVSADSKEYKELNRLNALVLKKDSKSPAIINWWNGYSACIDLTKPEAVNWLKNKLKTVQVNYGVDGFKFDASDFDFYMKGGLNYLNDPTNTTGTAQAEAFGKLGAAFEFNEFRAGWKNGNQPLAQRLQDKSYSWDDIKLLLPDMISAGIIGHPFTCPDMIGGGLRSDFENLDSNNFDQELLIRSAQIQALMPMMQFSVAPWRVLDTVHLKLCREAALLHTKMGSYIFELAQKAAIDGEPIVRHMEYAFPNEGFEQSNDQYMLGTRYLVAPMVTKGYERTVKLPKGNWIDDLGIKYKGGQTITISVPLKRLPYFKKI